MRWRPADPLFQRAQGMNWLLRFFHGETIKGMAISDHTYRNKVRKLMKIAAAGLIDQAQQTLLADTFPRMVKLLNAAIDQQLEMAQAGKPIDTALVERMMRGLYITDAPQLKHQLVQEVGGEGESVETLEGFVAKRITRPTPPNALPPATSSEIVDAETVKDGHAN